MVRPPGRPPKTGEDAARGPFLLSPGRARRVPVACAGSFGGDACPSSSSSSQREVEQSRWKMRGNALACILEAC